MNRVMRFKISRPLAIPYAAALIFVFLSSQRAAAQESTPPDAKPSSKPKTFVSDPFPNSTTSARGPLQQRLAEEFPDSFREGVDIFLEPRDGWVSQEVFDWWVSRLEREGPTPEGAERMFERISEESPVFSSPGRRQICAVVGASRNLLGSRYGDLIDAHGFVFRVNRAPTDDYDSDVGTKTTHHVAWPTDRTEDQADREAFLLLTPVTLHVEDLFDWILNLVENDLCWDPGRVRIIHPEFVKYLHEDWTEERGGFPSTGFIAMMLAVHVCDEVDVFGFGADALGRWDRYYEDDPVVPTDLHAADFEGELRWKMEEKGILKVYLGNRSANGVEFPGFTTEESEQD
jgi:hypothetical protein